MVEPSDDSPYLALSGSSHHRASTISGTWPDRVRGRAQDSYGVQQAL
jgi:hypothetical protein